MSIQHRIINGVFKMFNRELKLGRGVTFDPRAFPARGGAIEIGDDTVIRAGTMLLPAGGSIKIGRRTSLNHYVVVNGEGGVRIGDDVMIAAFTAIFAGSHRFDDPTIPMRQQGMVCRGGVTIEDDVWIGSHCVILDGVRIGKGSVIAAGSVVLRDIEPFSVMAGVPARLIRRRLANS